MREKLIMLLCNTMELQRNTTAVLITLEFMTFAVWHERDSGKARGGGGAETIAVVRITLGFMTLGICYERDSGIAGGGGGVGAIF